MFNSFIVKTVIEPLEIGCDQKSVLRYKHNNNSYEIRFVFIFYYLSNRTYK